jgi:hypothetical protein
MALRYKGRAEVDPENPRAFGMCHRCRFQYNLHTLVWQYDYQGVGIVKKNLLVCPSCLDELAQFKRTIIVPVDPPPLYFTSPENYDIDETGDGSLPVILTVATTPGAGSIVVGNRYTRATLRVIGGAGVQTNKFYGAGGGAWADASLSVAAGDVLYWSVGTTEQPSWVRKNVNAPPTLASHGCYAVNGHDTLGGLASACVGDHVFSGGDGHAPSYGNGGGGGAGGASGAGKSGGKGARQLPNNWGGGGGGGGANGGVAAVDLTTQTDGGAGGLGGVSGAVAGTGGTVASPNGGLGTLGSGGGGGHGDASVTGAGGNGGSDLTFDATHGCGGGGGGAGSSGSAPSRRGGDGGLYGGGAGGGDTTAGTSAPGICVIELR